MKQPSSQAILHLLELLKCLKMIEFLSVSRCSRTLVDKCRLVSPTYVELHSAQINLYTTLERNDLGTESLTVIKILLLNIYVYMKLDNMRRKTTMLFNLQNMFRLGTQTIIS